MSNRDFFDKAMQLPGINKFYPLYKKNKEVLLYLFFGVCTTLFNWFVFYICNKYLLINELISNIIAWVAGVVFAFVTNRTFVFEKSGESIISELIKFSSGRAFTLFLEELELLVFVSILKYNAMIIKAIGSVITVILNYVISKLIVFKKREV